MLVERTCAVAVRLLGTLLYLGMGLHAVVVRQVSRLASMLEAAALAPAAAGADDDDRAYLCPWPLRRQQPSHLPLVEILQNQSGKGQGAAKDVKAGDYAVS
jgi:hypothetical protein